MSYLLIEDEDKYENGYQCAERDHNKKYSSVRAPKAAALPNITVTNHLLFKVEFPIKRTFLTLLFWWLQAERNFQS